MADRLIFQKLLKDGRVTALNTWTGGFQNLVYPSLKAFEAAKKQVEEEGRVPHVTGYTPVS